MGVYGQPVGGFGIPKTFVITDNSGNDLIGVVVGEKTIFTATDNDVREGSVYASEEGVSTGTKVIPAYHTTEGVVLIPSGSEFVITISKYDYTKLQAIICAYNTSLTNSVSAEKISVNDNVYAVGSTASLATVIKDSSNQNINFGITNEGSTSYVIRYFTYKEEV